MQEKEDFVSILVKIISGVIGYSMSRRLRLAGIRDPEPTLTCRHKAITDFRYNLIRKMSKTSDSCKTQTLIF